MNTSTATVLKNEIERLQFKYKGVISDAARYQSLADELERLAASLAETIDQLNDDLAKG